MILVGFKENFMSEIVTKCETYLQNIIKDKNDDECQHSWEDELHGYIIENMHLLSTEEIKECQRIYNQVKEMDFARWCA